MEKNESPPMYPVVPVLNDVSGGPDIVYFGILYVGYVQKDFGCHTIQCSVVLPVTAR